MLFHLCLILHFLFCFYFSTLTCCFFSWNAKFRCRHVSLHFSFLFFLIFICHPLVFICERNGLSFKLNWPFPTFVQFFRFETNKKKRKKNSCSNNFLHSNEMTHYVGCFLLNFMQIYLFFIIFFSTFANNTWFTRNSTHLPHHFRSNSIHVQDG